MNPKDKLTILNSLLELTKDLSNEINQSKYMCIEPDGELVEVDYIDFSHKTSDQLTMLRTLVIHEETIINRLLTDYLHACKTGTEMMIRPGLIKSFNTLKDYFSKLYLSAINGESFEKELSKSGYYCVVFDKKPLWGNNDLVNFIIEPVLDDYKIEKTDRDLWINYLQNENPLVTFKRANNEQKIIKPVIQHELNSLLSMEQGSSKTKLIGLIKTKKLLDEAKIYAAQNLFGFILVDQKPLKLFK